MYDANGFRAQAGAGQLWARIAEIGTNRPIFANRDGVKLYDFDQLTDRRTGYSWFGDRSRGDAEDIRHVVDDAPTLAQRVAQVAASVFGMQEA